LTGNIGIFSYYLRNCGDLAGFHHRINFPISKTGETGNGRDICVSEAQECNAPLSQFLNSFDFSYSSFSQPHTEKPVDKPENSVTLNSEIFSNFSNSFKINPNSLDRSCQIIH